MTINDIEYYSGLTSGNILFYERHDIISPSDMENGHRHYHKHHLDALRTLRLLRTLGMPLENVKAVLNKEATLDGELHKLINKLTAEPDTPISLKALEICKDIQSELKKSDELEAEAYLNKYKDFFDSQYDRLAEDSIPQAPCPIRRLLARWFDWHFYLVLWMLFVNLVLGGFEELSTHSALIGFFFAPLLLMFILEPLFLMIFTATPGKWILGLRVRNNNGGHLFYTAGLARLATIMFLREEGTYRYEKWYYYPMLFEKCINCETLRWEYDSTIYLKDDRTWRTVAFIISCVTLVVAGYISLIRPINSFWAEPDDTVTMSEFVDNYNKLTPALDDYSLTIKGTWANRFTVYVNGEPATSPETDISDNPHPVFSYTTIDRVDGKKLKDPIITGISFNDTQENVTEPFSYRDEMVYIITAFISGQPEYKDGAEEIDDMIEDIEAFEDFEFTVCGVSVSCNVEYSGYNYTPALHRLYKPNNSVDSYVTISFNLTKN